MGNAMMQETGREFMLLQRIWHSALGLAGDARGTLAVMVALAAPALIACAGVAVDTVMMARMEGQLQATADTAALAAVKELDVAGTSEQQVKSVATTFIDGNLSGSALKTDGVPLSSQVTVFRKEYAVEVRLEKIWRPFFMHFLSADVTPIRVKARAQSIGHRLACVLGLSPKGQAGVHLLAQSKLTANNCDVYSNTDGPAGLIIADSAKLKSAMTCVVGGYVGGASAVPQPVSDCPVFEDPLAARQQPSIGGCDHDKRVIKDTVTTLDPGVYCDGLKIVGNAKVTLNPGVYVMRDGEFKVSNTASVTGENTGIFFTGDNSTMTLDPDSTISLTAPKSGVMAGILFFEDRDAKKGRQFRIASNNAHVLLGTIYLSRGRLLIDANAPVADNSAYTAIIADNLQLREGPNLVLNGNFDDTDIPVPAGLIAGRAVLTQ
jgi:Putative Flp pilus-assembly TadE/G-like